MSAPVLMVLASMLFATMGVCVKLASAHYNTGEIVLYRSLIGLLVIGGVARWRGNSLRTARPAMHFWRGVTGTTALMLWFYAISGLPLATAMTLNYMSSVWIALFLLGGAVMLGGRPAHGRSEAAGDPLGGWSRVPARPGVPIKPAHGRSEAAGDPRGGWPHVPARPEAPIHRVDGRLVAAVLVGFGGVALVLRPTLEQQQLWHGLAGLLSGLLAAMAYLQVTTLGRAGEPATRVVFYFSLCGATAGALLTLVSGGLHAHTLQSAALVVAIGVLATTAQTLMTHAYHIGRTLSNASLQYLGIAFSFGYGAFLFDDPVTWMAVAGMLLIVTAGLAATLVRSRTAPDDAKESTTEL